ncbi:MAG: hypothetical protein IPI24_02120 [Ignavibacteria bacterium]|nr:hypothetical protein [Ignavibacteria bacterium]
MFGPEEQLSPTLSEFIALLFFLSDSSSTSPSRGFEYGSGAIVSLVSLTCFYAWMLISSGTFLGRQYFISCFPAFLYALYWTLERKENNGPLTLLY